MLKNEKILDQYSPDKPFTILFMGKNYNDGLGDFVHLYDFYNYLKEKYKDEKRVKIQCISFIDDEKLKMINRIYRTEFKLTENQLKVDNDIIFFRIKRSTTDTELLNELIRKNQNPDLVFLAPIRIDNQKAILDALNPRSHIYLSEYEHNVIDTASLSETISDGLWSFKQCMGVTPDSAGIKIIQPIIDAKVEFEKNGSAKYENSYLQVAKADDAFLAAGYMQSKFQADLFIMNSIALAGNQSVINIATNFEANNANNELFYSDNLNHYIKSLNFSRIEVVSPTGEVVFERNDENITDKKVLRIIQFKNISEHDKHVLFSRADCVGASGDTSCSELISSAAFPCIVKKIDFINQLKDQATKLGLSTLVEYFDVLSKVADLERSNYVNDLMSNKDYSRLEDVLHEYNKAPKFIAEHHNDIQSQWQILCTWVIENKNVFNLTDCLIKGAMKHAAGQLKIGDIEAMYTASLQPDTNKQGLVSQFSFLTEDSSMPKAADLEQVRKLDK